MKAFKQRWEIEKNWQLLFPILGILGLLFSAYKIFTAFFGKLLSLDTSLNYTNSIITIIGTLIITYLLLKLTLKIFDKLENRWVVDYKWELIAIFIVFAVTGSTAAKVSSPFLNLFGFNKESVNPGIYWVGRIFFIFPIYQVLLIIFGWLFGQFDFFWAFEKKMLKRMGFKRFFKEDQPEN